ncbi:hypothetical protein M422DRAFT_63832 [Sphaerobolus stellatus SS14]|nr:hypothetical protein M422DRAFT_63832 [Sphaerobolus stellatus SS14]
MTTNHASNTFHPPRLYDYTIADIFTVTSQSNPDIELVHVLEEHVDEEAPITEIRHTWKTVLQHAQNAAQDLRERSGQAARQPGGPPVVAGLLGLNRYEYYINLLACVLNRWTALPISPKNSPDAIEHLLKTSQASVFLVDQLGASWSTTIVLPATVNSTGFCQADVYESCVDPAPSIELLTANETAKEYDLPAFYMHTSGSTGHPKLITWTHRFVLSGSRMRQRDGEEAMLRPFFCAPPLWHAMGMFVSILFPPAHSNPLPFISTPRLRPLSAFTLLKYAPFMKGGIVCVTPSLLEELWELGDERIAVIAENFWMVIYAGAALRRNIGDGLVQRGVHLVGAYGSTELLPATKIVHPTNPFDWEYCRFRDGYKWHMLPLGGEDDLGSNLKELVVCPDKDTPAVINSNDPYGFITNDIWESHPSEPGLWRYHSRKGDVTVLSTGEKTDNKQIENLLVKHPSIQYALVFGAGKPLNGVLVQPTKTSIVLDEFLNEIQETITYVNTIIPKHSRLVPELIIFASPNKPFHVTDKGTVRRVQTLDLYKDEIAKAYGTLETGFETDGVGAAEWRFEGDANSTEDIRTYIRETILNVMGEKAPSNLSDSRDLFEYGFDSLFSLQLRAAVLHLLKHAGLTTYVPSNVVYTHPSVNLLVSYILLQIHSTSNGMGKPPDGLSEDNAIRMSNLIDTYSADFKPRTVLHTNGNVKPDLVFAVTGSTGSVGSSVLELLLHREDVEHIYLLNRRGNAPQYERHVAAFAARGIDPYILKERANILTYIDIDLSAPDLGLDEDTYNELRDSITHLIHCAWNLNFNLILESYERIHIAGVRHLINLCLESPLSESPRFVFLSSAAASEAYSDGDRRVPEVPLDDPRIALDQGYGQSKFVSEQIVVRAVQHAGLAATVIRVGQLSGTRSTGAWNLNEHVPILIRSSVEMGIIPEDIFLAVRWLPSDIAAFAVLKQTLASSAHLEYFHVENPTETHWGHIAEAICKASPKSLKPVSSSIWLEEISKPNIDPERVPAARLLEFFHILAAEGDKIAVLDTKRAIIVAPELQFGKISDEYVKTCVDYQMRGKA